MEREELIRKIKYLKEHKGVTYSFIAKQVGLDGTTISHFVTSGRYLSKERINKLNNFITGGFLNEI